MAATAGKENEAPRGVFYKTDEELLAEITRFLSTVRKNRGATEWQIMHVVQRRPFVTALKEAREDTECELFRSHKEQLRFFLGLRRYAVCPVVKKLLNEGYSVAEIADALTMPQDQS